MKKITVKGVDYEMRNQQDEITLLETSKIAAIMADDGDFTDKWMRVIEILGSRELVNVMTAKQFVELVSAIQMNDVTFEIKPTIEVGGRTYSLELVDGEIDLSAKDMALIENIAKKGGAWLHYAYAVVYKDDQLTNTEHYAAAHIKHKAELFGENITSDQASSVVFQLNKQVVDNVQQLINAASPQV